MLNNTATDFEKVHNWVEKDCTDRIINQISAGRELLLETVESSLRVKL